MIIASIPQDKICGSKWGIILSVSSFHKIIYFFTSKLFIPKYSVSHKDIKSCGWLCRLQRKILCIRIGLNRCGRNSIKICFMRVCRSDSDSHYTSTILLPNRMRVFRIFSTILSNWNIGEFHLLIHSNCRHDISQWSLYTGLLLFLMEFCDFLDNW